MNNSPYSLWKGGPGGVCPPTPLPAGQAERTRVRHGAGYTSYEQSGHGLVQELTVFVPPDAALKIVRLRVRNTLPLYSVSRMKSGAQTAFIRGSTQRGWRTRCGTRRLVRRGRFRRSWQYTRHVRL